MPWIDTQQVCENGHQITDTYRYSPTTRKDFCTECGAKTITSCPNCGKDIPGETHYERVVNLSGIRVEVPNICQYCGSKYPWADKRKTAKKIKITNLFSGIKLSKTTKLIGAIFTALSIILGIITNGFQVWDFLKPKAEKKVTPIINISISPLRINYSNAYNDDKSYELNAKIETGNGVYRFLDSLYIDSLKLIDSSYFILDYNFPKIVLEKSDFDKMILGETKKEQQITIHLRNDFILKGDKVFELSNLKTDKLIANTKISFPYYFEGVKFTEIIDVPVFVYRK